MEEGKGIVAMLQKVSTSSIATMLLVILLLVSILYFPIRNLYPEYDIFFMIFGQFIGSIFLILFIIVVAALMVFIVRRVLKLTHK
jgi:hypothetical protein